MLDDDECYRAALSKDARFDGWFVGAVTSTGIYCRPSCPVVTPKRRNIRWYATPAAAQTAGFRACKRCRPDAAPGSPEWDARGDVVGRAMGLIADGLVDRSGVAGLARVLGYSERHLHRLLTEEVGAGPLALARAQRAQTARTLVESTTLPMTEVAYASGFGSIRQFNSTVRQVYALAPGELRRRARTSGAAPGVVALRLPHRRPLDHAELFAYLAERVVPGLDEGGPDWYRRSLALPHGPGVVTVRSTPGPWIGCEARLADLRDLAPAVQRCRRLLDLDADPQAVADQLAADEVLRTVTERRPGLRVPGHPDPCELVVRAVLVRHHGAARGGRLATRLVAALGEPLDAPVGAVTHVFPDAARLAARGADLPVPDRSRRVLAAVATAMADATVVLDAGADRVVAETALAAVPGLDRSTVRYVVMRALGHPDVFLPTDRGVRRALDRVGLPSTPEAAAERARAWAPWRSYAVHHLWAAQRRPPAPAAGPELPAGSASTRAA